MFACRRLGRNFSYNCKVLEATISWNAWLSFAYKLKMCIFAKTKQCLHADAFADIGAVIPIFLGKHLSELCGSFMHNIFLEEANYCIIES